MRLFPTRFFVLLAISFVPMALMFTGHAVAGEVFEIPIAGFAVDVVEFAFALIAGAATLVIAFLSNTLSKKVGIDVDEKTRAYLDEALLNGIRYAEQRVLKRAADLGPIEIENEFIATTASYVLGKVPDALAHFDITDEHLVDLIVARLPFIQGDDVVVTALGAASEPAA